MEILVVVLEIIGTVAFAVSGALVAVEKKMDIFGVAILGLVTATGGGVLRDVILGILPPRTFTNPVYALVALGTALVMFFPVLRRAKGGYKIFMDKLLLVMDSLGLAIFTVVGMRIAVDAGFQDNYFLLIFVGVVTGVGGGIMRDVFAGNRPHVFVKHFYATASLLGSVVFLILHFFAGEIIPMIAGAAVTFVLRILAATFRWSLPVAHGTDE